MKKLNKIMLGLAFGMFSFNSYAIVCPIQPLISMWGTPSNGTAKVYNLATATQYPTATYWKQCYQSIEAHSFGGAALATWTDLKLNYQQKYHAEILSAVLSSSENKIKAYNTFYQSIIDQLNVNYAALSKARIQIKTEMLENELDYKKELQQQSINEKNYGMFNDGNGEAGIVRTDTQSYKYFKEVCKRNKMYSKTSGTNYQLKRNASVNKAVTAKTAEMTNGTVSTTALATTVIQKHSSNYCSAFDIKYNQCVNPDLKLCVDNDVESGVCKTQQNEVFEETNNDTDAVNFLTPEGYNGRYSYNGSQIEEPKNRIEDELFDVDYTYTEEQKAAARSFSEVLIYQPSVKAPTTDEQTDPKKSMFVSEYDRYISNLNLANFSFENAIKSREELDLEGEIPMSERDVLRYIIHSFGNPDALVAAKSGKNLSKETMIYQLMTIKNKLDLNSFEQNERMETLMAALLAQQANDPELIENLNYLKK